MVVFLKCVTLSTSCWRFEIVWIFRTPNKNTALDVEEVDEPSGQARRMLTKHEI